MVRDNYSRVQRHAGCHPILCVDSYRRGISIGRGEAQSFDSYLLIEGGHPRAAPLRSRYSDSQSDPLLDLERHLRRLSARGELRQATVLFGIASDPFHPFDDAFPTSMRFLEMFERYSPGRLIVQTRSPLIVIGMPVLKKLRENTYVTIGIETPQDEARQRYTPELPGIEERWKTVRTLRRFGIRVGIQVSPMIPYGDWQRDADAFAHALCETADYITLRSLSQSAHGGRPQGGIASKLASERNFFWLRADAHRPLEDAIARRSPEKLIHPASIPVPASQLELFERRSGT